MHPGNLSAAQLVMLRDMWATWYAMLDRAPGHARSTPPCPSPPCPPSADAAAADAPSDSQAVEALLAAHDSPKIEQALWDFAKMEDPDSLFCRFLRARKWDMLAALNMLSGALMWRLDSDLEVRVPLPHPSAPCLQSSPLPAAPCLTCDPRSLSSAPANPATHGPSPTLQTKARRAKHLSTGRLSTSSQ